MKALIGLLGCIIIYGISVFLGSIIHLPGSFFPYSFPEHTLMLLLSVLLIYLFRKQISFRFGKVRPKLVLLSVAMGLAVAIISGILSSIFLLGIGSSGVTEKHIAFSTMTPLQFILFVFIYASLAEELLYRGFLQNMLFSLQSKGIRIFSLRISLPVLISALVFSASHLILLASGAGAAFIGRTLFFTFLLGITAGYFQEKNSNTTYAFVVHMTGNLPGVLSILWLS